jgi:hypothetical protein
MADKNIVEEFCKRHASAVLAASARLPSRHGLWVTVVVHDRDGQDAACVSTCLTAEELRTLGPVLSRFGEQLSQTTVATSPWATLVQGDDE